MGLCFLRENFFPILGELFKVNPVIELILQAVYRKLSKEGELSIAEAPRARKRKTVRRADSSLPKQGRQENLGMSNQAAEMSGVNNQVRAI